MKYQVWSEGYSCTGEHASATHHGTYEAENFKEACIKCFGHNNTFKVENLTLWGCILYDNEKDARHFFG